MAMPETMRGEIEGKLTRYCGDIPERVKDKLRLEFTIRGNSVTIFESRPVFQKPDIWTHTHVAQFRYDPGTKGWTLYAAGVLGTQYSIRLTKVLTGNRITLGADSSGCGFGYSSPRHAAGESETTDVLS